MRRTVSWPIDSTMFNSTSRFAKSRSVQRRRPSGAFEQQIATSLASLAPSSKRSFDGRHCFFRANADSNPSSTNRRRMCSMVRVVTPSPSAIRASIQPGPTSDWSACRSTRAWVSFRAAARPTDTSRCKYSRSSGSNRTTYRLLGLFMSIRHDRGSVILTREYRPNPFADSKTQPRRTTSLPAAVQAGILATVNAVREAKDSV